MTEQRSPRARPTAVPTAHPATLVLSSLWDQPTRDARPRRQGGHVRRALVRVLLRGSRAAADEAVSPAAAPNTAPVGPAGTDIRPAATSTGPDSVPLPRSPARAATSAHDSTVG